MLVSAAALGAGSLLLLAVSLPRHVAGTRLRLDAALMLDLAMPLTIFMLVAGASGRPIFAGLVTVALGSGYAYADRAKRRTLEEPIVFTDVFQAFDIFRHPQLALPFPNKGGVLLGVALVLACFAALYYLEPGFWGSHYWMAVAVIAALSILGSVFLRRGPSPSILRFLRRMGASGDPVEDAARLGPLAMHWVHALVAAGERATRRAGASGRLVAAQSPRAASGPLVLVQSESFFDARRLHHSIDRALLPNFDRACREGLQSGRLEVPCWGANTVRSEFSVLSGLAQSALGFDRFNPYHRFADVPVATIATRMRELGYRTICLHPFDGRFYGRDRIMPNLGFDELLDESAFASDASRVEGYISDTEVARLTLQLLRKHGPKVFIFVVTMENHGPWRGRDATTSEAGAGCLSVLTQAEGRALTRYLSSLQNADTMLGMLRDVLEFEFENGVLAFYGDHLPGFDGVYGKLGFADRRSDYLIWRAGAAEPRYVDIGAEDLAVAVLAAGGIQVDQDMRTSQESAAASRESATTTPVEEGKSQAMNEHIYQRGLSFAQSFVESPAAPAPAVPVHVRPGGWFDKPPATPPNPLESYFDSHGTGHGIWKWRHYFDIYHRHFAKFVGKEVHILEIGIFSGGSLDMWREYFGPKCKIYGVDILEACRSYERESVKVFIGDQTDRAFWGRFRQEVPVIDIVIDDGGHVTEQQIVSLEELLPHIRPGGVYLCEDLHGVTNAFHDYVSGMVHQLSELGPKLPGIEDFHDGVRPNALQSAINSIHQYAAVTVIEKNDVAVAAYSAPRQGSLWQPFY